jgi:hypothetical protein
LFSVNCSGCSVAIFLHFPELVPPNYQSEPLFKLMIQKRKATIVLQNPNGLIVTADSLM